MRQLQNDFTTPEQSKRLLELGLPQDSANMILDGYIDSDNRWVPDPYPRYLEHPYSVEIKNKSELYTSNVLPCWSVGRLIEIITICSASTYTRLLFSRIDDHTNIENLIHYISAEIENGHINFSKLEE